MSDKTGKYPSPPYKLIYTSSHGTAQRERVHHTTTTGPRLAEAGSGEELNIIPLSGVCILHHSVAHHLPALKGGRLCICPRGRVFPNPAPRTNTANIAYLYTITWIVYNIHLFLKIVIWEEMPANLEIPRVPSLGPSARTSEAGGFARAGGAGWGLVLGDSGTPPHRDYYWKILAG